MRLLTTSRMRVFQTCIRKHAYRYIEKRRPHDDSDGPRRFGTLWHLGQEHYWLSNADLNAGLNAIRSNTDDAHEAERACALLVGYHERWVEDTKTWKVLAVECEFRIPLVNPATGRASRSYELSGKIDLIVEANGEHPGVYVVEHKTSSLDISPGSVYWRKLRLDDQITNYILGGRSLGYDVQGVIYDVVSRPKHRPLLATPEDKRKYTKSGELYKNQRIEDESPRELYERIYESISASPDDFFQRSDPPVIRLDDEMEKLQRNTWNTAQQMVVDARRDWHPMNLSACDKYNRLCEYFPVCVGDASLEDPTLYEYSEEAHPELSKELQDGSTKTA